MGCDGAPSPGAATRKRFEDLQCSTRFIYDTQETGSACPPNQGLVLLPWVFLIFFFPDGLGLKFYALINDFT